MKKRSKEGLQPLSSEHSQLLFGQIIRRLRKERGMTQEQVAWTIEMSRVYLSELERGVREPCLMTILKLCRALALHPSDLFREYEKEQEET